MLKKRIIPVLLLKDGRMVKGKHFTDFRDVGNPVTAARVYNSQKVDEMTFLDIAPSPESKEKVRRIIQEVAKECFMPLTIGGGIQSLEDIYALLKIGADKISLNSAAVRNPQLIKQGAEVFGNQCMVVSVDYTTDENGTRRVWIDSGKTPTELDPLEHIRRCADLGAGEILITSIDREGTMTGYDLDFYQEIVKAVDIPVIASGGAGSLNDFLEAFTVADVSAITSGSVFHFTDQSPIKTRFFLYDHKVNVRV